MAESIQTYDRRQWWPSDFVDETMPPGRVSPDAWLIRLADGAPAIAGDDDYGIAPILMVEDREIEFTYQDTLGSSRLSFGDDGEATWTPEPPAACNYFWDGEYDGTLGDDPEEFVTFVSDAGYATGPGDWLEVRLYHIGSPYLRCRFTAQDGPPRFIPIADVPGAPADAVQAPAEDDAQGDLLRTEA